MSCILGLDPSTACVGITLIDPLVKKPLLLTHVTFEKDKAPKRKKGEPKVEVPDLNIYDKADKVKAALELLVGQDVRHVAIEEPLLAFGKMSSSAQTIARLQQFNGIVSYVAKTLFNVVPVHLNASHARKVCGVKFDKSIEGDRKQQTFDWLKTRDLVDVVWTTYVNKSGETCVYEYHKDEVDAYVVARAYAREVLNV